MSTAGGWKATAFLTAAAATTLAWSVALAASAPARRVELAGVATHLQATAGDSVTLRAYLRLARDADSDPRLPSLLAAWMAAGGSQSFAGRDFAIASREIGVELIGHAVDDLVVLEGSVPPGRLRASLRLLADVIMYPAIDASVAATAWSRVRLADGTGPAELARRALAASLDPVATRSYERPTRDEVLALHRRSAGRDAVVLAITGPIDGLDIEKDVRDAFTGFLKAGSSARDVGSEGKRTATLAVREVAPGTSRLVVAARGLPRSSADWLAVEVGLLATIFSVESDTALLPPMITIEQPVTGADLLIVDRLIPSVALGELELAYDQGFARALSGGLRSVAIERARAWVATALVPPADLPHAARAHALLEALGAPGVDPTERYRQLRELPTAAVAKATAKHLRP